MLQKAAGDCISHWANCFFSLHLQKISGFYLELCHHLRCWSILAWKKKTKNYDLHRQPARGSAPAPYAKYARSVASKWQNLTTDLERIIWATALHHIWALRCEWWLNSSWLLESICLQSGQASVPVTMWQNCLLPLQKKWSAVRKRKSQFHLSFCSVAACAMRTFLSLHQNSFIYQNPSST